MADIKISQLSEAQLVGGTDVFPMTSNGVTMKAPATAIKDYVVGTTDNSGLGADVSTQINNLHGQISDSGDVYTSSQSYAVGDLVIYDNALYKCITACSAGSWETNQSCFTQDTLASVVNQHTDAISQLNSDLINKVTTGTFDITVNATAYNNVYADRSDRDISITKPSDTASLIAVFVQPITNTYDLAVWVGRVLTSGNSITRLNIISSSALNNSSQSFRYTAFWA